MGKYKIIEDYFNNLGIIDIDDPEIFWENLERKLGVDFCIKANDAMSFRDISKSDAIYSVKNETLETSLEFVTYSKDLYRNYLKALIDLEISPKRILDIGSDNGIVTCMYGLLYPDSQVVGIDTKSKGIQRSKELAKKLGLTNVKFEQVDFKKLKMLNSEEKFDLVTSVRSVKEILMLFAEHRVWNLYEIEKIKTQRKERIAFEKLADFINEDGILILFERLYSIEEIIYFNKIVKESGYKLIKESLKYIGLQELGDIQKMPFMVYEKNQKEVENDIDILVNAFLQGNVKEFNDFMKKEDIELIYGIQINYANGSGNMREELYRENNELVYIKYSNIGYKELIRYKESEIDNMIKEIKEEFETYKGYMWTVAEYENIEKRPK